MKRYQGHPDSLLFSSEAKRDSKEKQDSLFKVTKCFVVDSHKKTFFVAHIVEKKCANRFCMNVVFLNCGWTLHGASHICAWKMYLCAISQHVIWSKIAFDKEEPSAWKNLMMQFDWFFSFSGWTAGPVSWRKSSDHHGVHGLPHPVLSTVVWRKWQEIFSHWCSPHCLNAICKRNPHQEQYSTFHKILLIEN